MTLHTTWTASGVYRTPALRRVRNSLRPLSVTSSGPTRLSTAGRGEPVAGISLSCWREAPSDHWPFGAPALWGFSRVRFRRVAEGNTTFLREPSETRRSRTRRSRRPGYCPGPSRHRWVSFARCSAERRQSHSGRQHRRHREHRNNDRICRECSCLNIHHRALRHLII